jgi:hypothetical protein
MSGARDLFRRLSHFRRFAHQPRYVPLIERLARIEAETSSAGAPTDSESSEAISHVQAAFLECDGAHQDSVVVASSLVPGAGTSSSTLTSLLSSTTTLR